MKRRSFLKSLGVLACGIAVGLELALPSLAKPQIGFCIRWQMLDHFKNNLRFVSEYVWQERTRDAWTELAA